LGALLVEGAFPGDATGFFTGTGTEVVESFASTEGFGLASSPGAVAASLEAKGAAVLSEAGALRPKLSAGVRVALEEPLPTVGAGLVGVGAGNVLESVVFDWLESASAAGAGQR
jgi:hypothetical protein